MHVANAVFGWDPMVVSSTILIISYVILFTEKLNRAVVALIGAGVMIMCGVLTQAQAIKGIDFNTLALLIGMMIVVGVSEKSGMFQYVAIWGAQQVKASPRGMMMVLAIVTAFFSALLDNVTTVLLLVPVTFQMTKKLKVNPYPYLILEIFASNIGGTATLIGDPPNILLGSALNLSFMDFVRELTPIVVLTMIALIAVFDFAYGRHMKTNKKCRAEVMRINKNTAITDKVLLVKSLIVLFSVIIGFVCAEHFHIANGTIAMTGAVVMIMLYTWGNRHDEREARTSEIFALVDWTTIFFFAGLFAIVYGLEESGVLVLLGQKFVEFSEGSIDKAVALVLWVSAIVSAAIDNIPFVATMIPVLKSMEPGMGGREAMMPVWWALSLGSCFGGNGTLIAASANVIVAGMAQREGTPISFLGFLKWSIPVMVGSVLIASLKFI